jgi:hypothetical protein
MVNHTDQQFTLCPKLISNRSKRPSSLQTMQLFTFILASLAALATATPLHIVARDVPDSSAVYISG